MFRKSIPFFIFFAIYNGILPEISLPFLLPPVSFSKKVIYSSVQVCDFSCQVLFLSPFLLLCTFFPQLQKHRKSGKLSNHFMSTVLYTGRKRPSFIPLWKNLWRLWKSMCFQQLFSCFPFGFPLYKTLYKQVFSPVFTNYVSGFFLCFFSKSAKKVGVSSNQVFLSVVFSAPCSKFLLIFHKLLFRMFFARREIL